NDVNACACGLQSFSRFEQLGLFEAVFNERSHFHPGQVMVHDVPLCARAFEWGTVSQDVHHATAVLGSTNVAGVLRRLRQLSGLFEEFADRKSTRLNSS